MTPDHNGIYLTGPLPDGRIVTVSALLFGSAKLHVGRTGSLVYDDEW